MEARKLSPAPSVQEVMDRAGFMELEPEWAERVTQRLRHLASAR